MGFIIFHLLFIVWCACWVGHSVHNIVEHRRAGSPVLVAVFCFTGGLQVFAMILCIVSLLSNLGVIV